MTSFLCCFPGIFKEALEVDHYHTVMYSSVDTGNPSFCLHRALKVRSLLQSLDSTKTFDGFAYLKEHNHVFAHAQEFDS